MSDIYAKIRKFAKELRDWADCDARAGEPLGVRMRLAADKLEELAAENERLKEDRARFPDRPDDIGQMIEAHIGNLKEGKKSAEALADKAFDRAFRAEAALAEKDKKIAELREAVEPFSRLASVLYVGDADDAIVIGVSAGDLRRARNVGGKDV